MNFFIINWVAVSWKAKLNSIKLVIEQFVEFLIQLSPFIHVLFIFAILFYISNIRQKMFHTCVSVKTKLEPVVCYKNIIQNILRHFPQHGAKRTWKSCSQYFLPSNWKKTSNIKLDTIISSSFLPLHTNKITLHYILNKIMQTGYLYRQQNAFLITWL